jgi:hypothetical protein
MSKRILLQIEECSLIHCAFLSLGWLFVLVLLCIIVLLTLQLLSVHKYAKEVWLKRVGRVVCPGGNIWGILKLQWKGWECCQTVTREIEFVLLAFLTLLECIAQVDVAEFRQKLQCMEILQWELDLLQCQKDASKEAVIQAAQKQGTGVWSRLAGSPPDSDRVED